ENQKCQRTSQPPERFGRVAQDERAEVGLPADDFRAARAELWTAFGGGPTQIWGSGEPAFQVSCRHCGARRRHPAAEPPALFDGHICHVDRHPISRQTDVPADTPLEDVALEPRRIKRRLHPGLTFALARRHLITKVKDDWFLIELGLNVNTQDPAIGY